MDEKNRFHQNRFLILERSHEKSETFEIAALAWAVETKQKDYAQELLEWMRHVNQLENGKADGINMMPEYFTLPSDIPPEK